MCFNPIKIITRALTPPKPKMPTTETLPPPLAAAAAAPPTEASPGVVAETEAERLRLLRQRGRASTLLTSGQGDTSAPDLATAGATGRKMLLG